MDFVTAAVCVSERAVIRRRGNEARVLVAQKEKGSCGDSTTASTELAGEHRWLKKNINQDFSMLMNYM